MSGISVMVSGISVMVSGNSVMVSGISVMVSGISVMVSGDLVSWLMVSFNVAMPFHGRHGNAVAYTAL